MTRRMVVAACIPVLLAFVLVATPWPWPSEVKYGCDDFVRTAGFTEASRPLLTDNYERTRVHFPSNGDELDAWLYLPRSQEEEAASAAADHKCVILAHGLGGQRDFALHRYAHVFASEGFAVLAFDYRCFGGSTGEPRNWVSPKRHVEDWVAAVQAVQPGGVLASSGLNCSSLALWGTSFAGGHVLVAAAKMPGTVNAIISQVPHLDGVEASKVSLLKRGLLGSLRMLAIGLHDALRSRLGMPAAYLKLVGRPGELVFMQISDAQEMRYFAKHPKVKLGGWIPWAPARLSLEVSRYSPIKFMPHVDAPVLFIAADKDDLCPPDLVRKAADSCGHRCSIQEYAAEHFDVYEGAVFADATKRMVGFLKEHL